MANENPPLIWIDCEMTGLSLDNDALVEIAVLVTDAELNVLGEGVDVVIATTPEKLAAMRDEVRTMHTYSRKFLEASHSPKQKRWSLIIYKLTQLQESRH
jgi:oligoribonuclease